MEGDELASSPDITGEAPTGSKEVLRKLGFPEAMTAVIDGMKVTRIEWENNSEYGYLKQGWLMIHTKGKDHVWQVSDGDLLAEDWIVMSELN